MNHSVYNMIVQYASMVFYGRPVSWQPIIRGEGYRRDRREGRCSSLPTMKQMARNADCSAAVI